MTDIGCSIFCSKKVSAFQWKELHKASILGRLWQNNLGTILTPTFSLIPRSSCLLSPVSYPYQKTFHTQTLIKKRLSREMLFAEHSGTENTV
ncbi:MAG: hypothetical protein F6K39_10980 [Okeania sp. SIO3B3]|nr:hypothetical protein [Okeania sp. SIO3B3]